MSVEAAERAPIRLRPTTTASIGTTAFFRNRALLRVLLGRIAALEANHITVLVHACSIGAEVWSLLIAAALDPRTASKRIHVTACDVEPDFIAYAQQGVYPRAVLEGMSAKEQSYFEFMDEGSVRVSGRIRAQAEFLPAQSVTDFSSAPEFDVVLLLNALLYLPGESQSLVIDRLAKCNRRLLVTTGFHLDRIKADVHRNRYRPCLDGLHAIHDAWSDRRRDQPAGIETVPGKIFHPWSLPAFSEIEDFEYKYCAVFEKDHSSDDC